MNPIQTQTIPTDGQSAREADFLDEVITLEAGKYWRYARPQEGDSGNFEPGQVLLLESIRWVDDDPHTIVVRTHPSRYYVSRERFLLQDFLDRFDFEPNGEAIRERELAEAQQRITDTQSRMLEIQADPSALREAMEADGFLPKSDSTDLIAAPQSVGRISGQSLPSLMARINDEQSLTTLVEAAGRFEAEASAKSRWLTHQVKEISALIEKLTPFFEEKAAVALAATEDVRRDVNNIMTGLDSLGLFVGKDVTVDVIAKGESAPADLPLTLQQRRLYANEELVVLEAVDDDFDFRREWDFFEKLASTPALVNQVFVSERAVVMMAVRASGVDYIGDRDASFTAFMEQMQRNRQNLATFFLIRDGDNIYRVFSPVATHEKADHLFPLNGEQDAIFNPRNPFRGMDCSRITFEDVRYTDALNQHERYLIHYRRVLLLLFGLQFKQGILGPFVPESDLGGFLSLEFQERYFRFVRDADHDGTAIGDGKPNLDAWTKNHYDEIRHGSLLMAKWAKFMTEETAPSAYTWASEFNPVDEISVAVAEIKDHRIRVKVPVRGENREGRKRRFNCTIDLTEAVKGGSHPGIVCLDRVDPESLQYYIQSRSARKRHTGHAAAFHAAAQWIRASDPVFEPDASPMRKALTRACLRLGSEKRLKRMQLDLDWLTEQAEKSYETLLADLEGSGLKRIVRVEANALSGALEIACEPDDDQRDDRLTPFSWLRHYRLSRNGNLVDLGWKQCHESEKGAIDLGSSLPYQLSGVLKKQAPAFATPEEKRDFFNVVNLDLNEYFDLLFGEKARSGELCNQFAGEIRSSHLKNTSRQVRHVSLGIPVGCMVGRSGPKILAVAADEIDAMVILDRVSKGCKHEMMTHQYSSRYSMEKMHREKYESLFAEMSTLESIWSFKTIRPDDWSPSTLFSDRFFHTNHSNIDENDLTDEGIGARFNRNRFFSESGNVMINPGAVDLVRKLRQVVLPGLRQDSGE